MAALYPMIIKPRFDERIWGGDALAARFGKAAPRDRPIGESWEIYEENTVANGPYAGQTIGQLRVTLGRDLMGHVTPDALFPLLTKLIDAHDVLSVQVHPDDRFAREIEHQPYGKTECWYVLEAADGAALTYGFSRDSSPEEYTALVQQGTLDQILRPLPVHAGDVVYIPAGTVHAIGAGIIVFELQQTSDVTYRIYDWNRRDAQGHPRELHVDKARLVLDYHRATHGLVRPLPIPGAGRSVLIAGQYFRLDLVDAASSGELSTYDSPVALCALEHPVQVAVRGNGERVTLAPYSSLLIPAAAGAYTLHPASSGDTARVLAAYVPASQDVTRQELAAHGVAGTEIDAFLAQFAPATDLGQAAALYQRK